MFGTSVDDDGYQRETTPLNRQAPMVVQKYLHITLQGITVKVINYMQ